MGREDEVTVEPTVDRELEVTGVPSEPSRADRTVTVDDVHRRALQQSRAYSLMQDQDMNYAYLVPQLAGPRPMSPSAEPTILPNKPIETSLTRTRIVNGFAVRDFNPAAWQRVGAGETTLNPTGLPDISEMPFEDMTKAQQTFLELRSLEAMVGSTHMNETDPAFNRLIARRLHALKLQNPGDFEQWTTEQFEALVGTQDPDVFRAASESEFAALASSTIEMVDMYLARERTIAQVQTSLDVLKLGSYESVDLTEASEEAITELTARVNQVRVDDEADLSRRIAFQDWDYSADDPGLVVGVATNPIKRARKLTDAMTADERSVELFFTPSSNRLTAIITYENETQGSIDVALDSGTTVTSMADALYELAIAKSGLSHTVRSENNILGPQTGIGTGFQTIGDGFDWIDKHNGTINSLVGNLRHSILEATNPQAAESYQVDSRSSAQIYADEGQRLVEQQVKAADSGFGRDLALVMAAGFIRDQNPEQSILAASQDLMGFDAMPDDEFEGFKQEVLDLEDLRKEFESSVDDRSTLKRAIDETLSGVGAMFQAYDAMVQQVGTTLVALGEAGAGLGTGYLREEYGIGLERFGAAWQESFESKRVADYFSLDGTFGSVVDFGASVLFDPFMWVTPGASALAKTNAWRLGTREGAEQVMRLGTTKSMAINMVKAVDNIDDVMAIIPAISAGVDPGKIAAFLRGSFPEDDAYQAAMRIIRESLPANGGLATMNFSGHAVTLNTSEMAARLAQSFDTLPRKSREWFVRNLTEFSTTRSVSLGPHAFVDDFLDDIISVYFDNPARAQQWLTRTLEGADNATTPYVGGVRTAQTRLAELQDDMTRVMSSTPREVKNYKTRVANLERRQQRLRRIQTEGTSARPADLARAIERGDAALAVAKSHSAAYETFKAERTRLTKQIADAKDNAVRAISGNNSKQLGAMVSDFYDEVADQLPWIDVETGIAHAGDEIVDGYTGLRRTKSLDPFTGKPIRDWSPVTGTQGWTPVPKEAGVDNLVAFATRPDGSLDETLYNQLKASGAMSHPSTYRRPVRPDKLVAYRSMNNPQKWAEKILDPSAGTRAVKAFVNGVHSVWGVGVLMTPVTAFRSAVDEPLRFIAKRGLRGGGKRAVGIGGAFDEGLEIGRIPGNAQIMGRQLAAPVPGLGKIRNTYAQMYRRNLRAPFEKTSQFAYKMVDPKDAGYVAEADWWVNGVLLRNNPIVSKAWAAIGIDDYPSFKAWWNDAGKFQSPGRTRAGTIEWKTADGVALELGPAEAYEAARKSLDLVVSFAAPSNQARVRAALILSASDGSPVPPAVLRLMNKPLPGRVLERGGKGAAAKAGGARDWMFDKSYGSLAEYRGGAWLQERWADYAEPIYKAHTDRGSLLTANRLAEIAGVDEQTALTWLNNAGWEVDMLLKHYGMVTKQQVADSAYRAAQRSTTNAMYQSGAASVGGKRFQKLYPFGPAQFDFASYYFQQMTNAMELKLPGMSHAFQVARPGGKHVPFNLRLAARAGEVFGNASYHADQYRKDNPGAYKAEQEGVNKLIDDATFMPTDMNNLVIDLGPGLGPIWSYMLHWLPSTEDGENVFGKYMARVREMSETFHPALEFDDRQFMLSNPGQAIAGAGDYLMPESRGRPRRVLTDLSRAVWSSGLVGGPNLNDPDITPNELKAVQERITKSMELLGEPLGFRRVFKDDIGLELEQNGPWVMNSENELEIYATALEHAASETSTGQLKQSVANATPFGDAFYSYEPVGGYFQHYSGMMENLDLYVAAGVLGDSAAVQLRDRWAVATETKTYDDLKAFTDQAWNILVEIPQKLQDLLLIQHGGTAMNLTSSYKCQLVGGLPPAGIPEGVCGLDGRLNLPPDAEERDRLWKEGRSSGWLIPRDTLEVAQDANVRVSSAHRRWQTLLWQGVTGDSRWRGPSTDKNGEPNLPKKLQGNTYEVTDFSRGIAESLGIELGDRVTGEDLADLIETQRTIIRGNIPDFNQQTNEALAIMTDSAKSGPGYGEPASDADLEFVDLVTRAMKKLDEIAEDQDIAYSELPSELQEGMRAVFRSVVAQGFLGAGEYAQKLQGKYGPLDWQTPQPPSVTDLDFSIPLGTSYEVVDGDTIRVWPDNGAAPYRVRLIGVNAVDYNSLNSTLNERAIQQRKDLEAVLGSGADVRLGVFDPELYGSFQTIDDETGEVRVKMWLYINGEARFDPDVFTWRNPEGVASTGAGVPIAPIPERDEVVS